MLPCPLLFYKCVYLFSCWYLWKLFPTFVLHYYRPDRLSHHYPHYRVEKTQVLHVLGVLCSLIWEDNLSRVMLYINSSMRWLVYLVLHCTNKA